VACSEAGVTACAQTTTATQKRQLRESVVAKSTVSAPSAPTRKRFHLSAVESAIEPESASRAGRTMDHELRRPAQRSSRASAAKSKPVSHASWCSPHTA
jgi:hypothetical protein